MRCLCLDDRKVKSNSRLVALVGDRATPLKLNEPGPIVARLRAAFLVLPVSASSSFLLPEPCSRRDERASGGCARRPVPLLALCRSLRRSRSCRRNRTSGGRCRKELTAHAAPAGDGFSGQGRLLCKPFSGPWNPSVPVTAPYAIYASAGYRARGISSVPFVKSFFLTPRWVRCRGPD